MISYLPGDEDIDGDWVYQPVPPWQPRIEESRLILCNKCGCTYLNKCPTHPEEITPMKLGI